MKKEDFLKRVQDLSKAVNESLENHQRLKTTLDNATHAHNALVGRLDEANYLYNEFSQNDIEKKDAPKEEKARK